MPIRSSDGEIIGVAQAINKIPEGAPFTEDDEKVRLHALHDLDFSILLTDCCSHWKGGNYVNSSSISLFTDQRAFPMLYKM